MQDNDMKEEWYNGHAARIVQAIQLRGDQKEAYERIAGLVAEERKRVWASVRGAVEDEMRGESEHRVETPKCDCTHQDIYQGLLSRLYSLDKMG